MIFASHLSIAENGISNDVWGSVIGSSYMYKAESQLNNSTSKTTTLGYAGRRWRSAFYVGVIPIALSI